MRPSSAILAGCGSPRGSARLLCNLTRLTSRKAATAPFIGTLTRLRRMCVRTRRVEAPVYVRRVDCWSPPVLDRQLPPMKESTKQLPRCPSDASARHPSLNKPSSFPCKTRGEKHTHTHRCCASWTPCAWPTVSRTRSRWRPDRPRRRTTPLRPPSGTPRRRRRRLTSRSPSRPWRR